jgi:hypothetical protein
LEAELEVVGVPEVLGWVVLLQVAGTAGMHPYTSVNYLP